MIELLKDIMVDFILFSAIEGIIFTKFFQIVGGCKKFKWWEIGILSLVNCVVSQTLPPLIYQLVGIIFMGIMLFMRKDGKLINTIKLAFFAGLYLLILEIFYSIILGFVININPFYTESKMGIFISLIPIRFIEIILISSPIGGKYMKNFVNTKFWVGDNIKRR